MKIVLAGEWRHSMYERAIAEAMVRLGHEIVMFSWEKYFSHILGRLESKYCLVGPSTALLNLALKRFVSREKPDVVLLWHATQVQPSTIRAIKKSGVRTVVSYNHDDFTGPGAGAPVPRHHHRLWRLFLQCAPIIDVHFVKRQSNVDHLVKLGVIHTAIIPMWFSPQLHRPVTILESEKENFGCDVVFVGHYEPDGREVSVRALIAEGWRVRIWGGKYWSRSVLGGVYEQLQPIRLAEGEDYAKALCGAQICLAFLSKLNRDTYTRRCFEIPACGRLMLAERTDDLLRMFKEDEEACFFSSDDELVRKVRWLLNNPMEREKIAAAGLRRVWADRRDVDSCAREMLKQIAIASSH